MAVRAESKRYMSTVQAEDRVIRLLSDHMLAVRATDATLNTDSEHYNLEAAQAAREAERLAGRALADAVANLMGGTG